MFYKYQTVRLAISSKHINLHFSSAYRVFSDYKIAGTIKPAWKTKERVVRSYFTPDLYGVDKQAIKHAVGIHISSDIVSWSSIDTSENCVTSLSSRKLPEDFLKFDLRALNSVAQQLVDELPDGDRYVLEGLERASPGNVGKLKLAMQATRMQFIAMITALINNKRKDASCSSVVFMKPKTSAKLFGLLIGTEQISSHQILDDILNGNEVACCKPVTTLASVLNEYYCLKNPVERELKGQALLILMTFLNFIVYQNDAAIQKIFNTTEQNR